LRRHALDDNVPTDGRQQEPDHKMQISEVRCVIAPEVKLTEEGLRKLQDPVWRQAAPGPLATASSSALLILAGMLGGDRLTIGDRVLRLWGAEHQFTGPCPVTKATTLGAAIAAVLEEPRIRGRLQWLQIDPTNEAATLEWNGGRRSVFHPHDPAEWRRRVANLRSRTGAIPIKRLPGGSFDKIAAKYEEMVRAEANQQPA
jgi:hypothetical protein